LGIYDVSTRVGTHLQLLTANVEAAWPWDKERWKPSMDPKRNLVKAGALIAAELDRLYELEKQNAQPAPAPEPIPETTPEPETAPEAAQAKSQPYGAFFVDLRQRQEGDDAQVSKQPAQTPPPALESNTYSIHITAGPQPPREPYIGAIVLYFYVNGVSPAIVTNINFPDKIMDIFVFYGNSGNFLTANGRNESVRIDNYGYGYGQWCYSQEK
jgi:hypothetical protein